jgi:hypothetical protein
MNLIVWVKDFSNNPATFKHVTDVLENLNDDVIIFSNAASELANVL